MVGAAVGVGVPVVCWTVVACAEVVGWAVVVF